MQFDSLVEAINFKGVVAGLTHDFYRYPARFSPAFARDAIRLFTKPGDTILDPFMGSATSLVEGMALGRNCVGIDISELAVFLAKVKTTVLSRRQAETLVQWAHKTAPTLSPSNQVRRHLRWAEAGYQSNMPWRYRKLAEQAINRAKRLPDELEAPARCIVLKTLQWALDCKKQLPSVAAFRDRLILNAHQISDGLIAMAEAVSSHAQISLIELFNGSADAVGSLPSRLLQASPAKLVVTSPPYPGVHVLYHRWQVQSRRETAAPFWIADCYDGEGAAFYTFGDRRKSDHEKVYFSNLLRTFAAIRRVVREDAYVVQLVGFGKPEEHLPRYVQTMREAGFAEYEPDGGCPHRFWRSVPNRKWYNWLREDSDSSAAEILLVHRPAR